MIGGELNYPWGRKRIDIALSVEKIGIEYVSWWNHGHRPDEDAERAAFLLNEGWKMLYIYSNKKVPFQWELDEAIARLRNGEEAVEIVLDDWGKGRTRADVRVWKRGDPWEKGPIPISWDGVNYVECQQLGLW